MKKRVLLTVLFTVFCLTIIFFNPAFANLPAPLAKSVQLLDAGKARLALDSLNTFISQNSHSPYLTTAHILAGRCEVSLAKPGRAIKRGQEVLEGCKDDGLRAQLLYMMATAYQARGDNYEAARLLIQCIDTTNNGKVAQLASNHLKELVNSTVYYRLPTLLELASTDQSINLLTSIQTPSSDLPKIGLVVQKSDSDSVRVRSLLYGVDAAVQLFNLRNTANQKIKVELVNIDQGPVPTVMAVRNLIRKKGVWGLILGGYEPDMLAGAIEAQAAGVPVVLPGMRSPNVSLIGPCTFQPEADWYREGEIAGVYATDSLRLKTFGIIAPVTEMGRHNVAGFIDAVGRRPGTEILATEWYFLDKKVSIDRQMKRIRKIGFRRAFADSLRADSVYFDSLSFDELWYAHHDSIKRTSRMYKIGKLDSNAINLKTIDGFYLPIEKGTIQLFAPQLAVYEGTAQHIGNSSWYDPDELYRHRQYVEGMILTSTYWLDDQNPHLADLRVELHKKTGEVPNPWHIRGYDAARLLFSQVESGRVGPFEVATGLKWTKSINYASGKQVFDTQKHTGLGMWLLSVSNGSVTLEDIAARRRLLELLKEQEPVQPAPTE